MTIAGSFSNEWVSARGKIKETSESSKYVLKEKVLISKSPQDQKCP